MAWKTSFREAGVTPLRPLVSPSLGAGVSYFLAIQDPLTHNLAQLPRSSLLFPSFPPDPVFHFVTPCSTLQRLAYHLCKTPMCSPTPTPSLRGPSTASTRDSPKISSKDSIGWRSQEARPSLPTSSGKLLGKILFTKPRAGNMDKPHERKVAQKNTHTRIPCSSNCQGGEANRTWKLI